MKPQEMDEKILALCSEEGKQEYELCLAILGSWSSTKIKNSLKRLLSKKLIRAEQPCSEVYYYTETD